MPTTDDYGQGISIASLTDAPDGPKLARDLADGLVPRSVMRFADAAERNATITSPEPGMLVYLEAEEQFTGYVTGGWQVLAAATTSWSTISLASGYSHDGNSNGSAQYRRIIIGNTDMVIMRGGIGITYSGGNLPNGGTITNTALPTTARPGTVRTFSVTCSSLSSNVMSFNMDAETNGHLDLTQTSGSTPPWISLNGVMYSL